MNIAILIQSSHDPKYTPCVQALERTWASVRVPGVQVLFYFGLREDMPHPPPNNQLRLGNTLICDTPDLHYMSAGKVVEVRTPKFVMALEYVLREMQADYIYRCNCTCYVDQQKLYRYMLDRPRENYYAGPRLRYKARIDFVSGCDMMISRDIAEKIVRDRSMVDPDLIDDVAFGKLVTESYIRPEEIHVPHRLLVYSEVATESQRVEVDHPGAFHYKFSAATMDALERFHQRHEAHQAVGEPLPSSAHRAVEKRSRERVLCIGAPFDTEYSSNSTREPELFEWTSDPNRKTVDTTVYIDTGVPTGLDQPGRKIAWLLEAPAINDLHGVVAFLRENLAALCASYEVILVSDRELCSLHPKVVYHPPGSNLPWIPPEKYGLYEKEKLCSMFASTKDWTEGHSLRQRWAERLQKKVDLFGGSCGSVRIGGTSVHPDKSEGLIPYMFNIAIENCRVDTYYSEKLTDCFATGTVPVYWGSPRVGDIFDPAGIIFLDDAFDIADLSEELYREMLPAVRNNLEIVSKLTGADDLLFRRYVSGTPLRAEHLQVENRTAPEDRIFVSIASYRDPEVESTIRDALEKADRPERLTIGVCLQDTNENLSNFHYRDHPQVPAILIPHEEADGVCSARSRIQCELLGNERYYLQLDSHSRFAPGWDSALIRMLNCCRSAKPIISTYPNDYDGKDHERGYLKNREATRIIYKSFSEDGRLRVIGGMETSKDTPDSSLWLAAGFLFTFSTWVREVPYDPRFYFCGEEDGLLIRSYTHGWDLFAPTENVVYHNYVDTQSQDESRSRPRHWADHPGRNSGLHVLEELQAGIGIGKARSIDAFQEHFGVNFSTRTMKEWARLGMPQSVYLEKVADRPILVSLDTSVIPLGRHRLWVFALFDESGQEVFRHDIHDEQVLDRRADQIAVRLPREACRRGFVKALLWPVLEDGTFLERHEYAVEQDLMNRRIVPHPRSFDLRTEGYDRSDNYKCWVFALLDRYGREIFRGDIFDPAFLRLEERRYTIADPRLLLAGPTQYVLWPLLQDGTYLERRQEYIEWVR